MIYYVQDPSDKMVKIGTASVMTRRLRQLEQRYGPLVLLGVHAGTRMTEKSLHSKFDKSRVPRTEWFSAEEPLLDWIEQTSHSWKEVDDYDADYDIDYGFVIWGEFLQWVVKFAEHLGVSISEVMCMGVKHLGETKGFVEGLPFVKERRSIENPALRGELTPPQSVETDSISNDQDEGDIEEGEDIDEGQIMTSCDINCTEWEWV